MDVSLAIKQRLDELGLEQRELARAAQVTESYISQLLTGRRAPPAPNRTDIYEKMDRVLKLPSGQLARLAAYQRKEQLARTLGDEPAPAPMFGEVRALIVRKCRNARRRAVTAIFEKDPFGELERLVTRSVLDLVKVVARENLENEPWLRTVARLSGRSFQDIRVVALEFLDTDILHVSPANCAAFLDPLIESWDIDLATFELEIRLHPKVNTNAIRRFGFMERQANRRTPEPGYKEFLENRSLSGSATPQECAYLASLRFTTGQPTALYFYRELQSLRDPLHFTPPRARPAAA